MGEIEPDGQYLPDDAEHDTQVDEDNAPRVLEYLPAAQSRQVSTAVAPTAAENLPVTQAVQVSDSAASPMSGPQYPALQVQDVLALLANADAALVPQVLQSASAVLAVKAL